MSAIIIIDKLNRPDQPMRIRSPFVFLLKSRLSSISFNQKLNFCNSISNFSIKIDDIISLEVSSLNDLSSVFYVLSARGNLVLSETEAVANQKSVVISFPATFAMVPKAQFVVYYIKSTGDIIAGSAEISVSGLNNFVSSFDQQFIGLLVL